MPIITGIFLVKAQVSKLQYCNKYFKFVLKIQLPLGYMNVLLVKAGVNITLWTYYLY